jgi:hypothetical protein
VKALPLIAFVMTISCGTTSSSKQHVQLAHLGFDVPSDWKNADTKQRGLVTSVWTPEDNDQKESIVVIRSDRNPEVARADSQTLARLLSSAQAAGAKVSATAPITTQQGLSGVRIEVDYVPPGLSKTYHRVHVVLVNGDSLVHVFYTARSPDSGLAAFTMVLSSIHEES